MSAPPFKIWVAQAWTILVKLVVPPHIILVSNNYIFLKKQTVFILLQVHFAEIDKDIMGLWLPPYFMTTNQFMADTFS